MQPSRRNLLGLAGVAVAAGAAGTWYVTGHAPAAPAQAATPAPPDAPVVAALPPTDPRVTERALGRADTTTAVHEFFSLTCPHCAAFARESFPGIRAKLIDTGKIRYVFHDFPLDQVALTAAMVARSLPPDRYEPFVSALLASQDRWAFARGVNSNEELAKMAALAGMSRATFDATVADTALRTALLQMQDQAVKEYKVDATPYFVFAGPGGKTSNESGEKSYDQFAASVAKVAGT